jgi:hypothetical protein
MIQNDKIQNKRLELRDEIQRKVIAKFPIQTELDSIIKSIEPNRRSYVLQDIEVKDKK